MSPDRAPGPPAAPEAAPLRTPWPVRLTVLPKHDCPYLPDRGATLQAFATRRLDPDVYHDFMDAGFRRSGRMVYRPACDGCRLCVPIRVPVGRFRPDKGQRRCERRNADLSVSVGEPVPTDEKFDLYRRYLTQWHETPSDGGAAAVDGEARASFEAFLYVSPVDTVEFTYRDPGGRLLAVGIADVSSRSFSSVYFYFDPAHRHRGLGTFGALHEIAWAARAAIPHYYLGYWVTGCRKMMYKKNFRPFELLRDNGAWDASECPDVLK
jgi:arginyl-tRNA--protein-N-Asp/Glu arginylyltransferase